MPFPPGVGARGVGRGSDMPFPPGVGGGGPKQGTDSSGAVMGGAESESFEVITAEKALDASNVGNRMLRNMGWQEGSVCEADSLTFFSLALISKVQLVL
jgi:RNA-binding protein 5/10